MYQKVINVGVCGAILLCSNISFLKYYYMATIDIKSNVYGGEAMKKIKENITLREYKKLVAQVKGQEMREYKRNNLLRTFVLLYYTGLRLNEVQGLKIKDLIELIETNELKIFTSKTNRERKLYLSEQFKKELLKIFDLTEDPENNIIQKHNYKRSSIHPKAYISMVNNFMKDTLGDGYTSHSFRQGLLTEMGSRGINVKLMSKFIGHKSTNTTLRYVTPTDDDIKNSMIR